MMSRVRIALICALGLIAGTACAQSGPVQSELKSYRCLVADFLVSSGGSSPAISPDGTVLVYKTEQPNDYENDKVWVLTDADRQLDYASGGVPAQPWKLVINERVQMPLSDPRLCMGEYRNVDWSPDGRRVAFTCHGHLYMAELADLKAKKTDVKKLCDVISNNDSDKDTPIVAPRWSPDGTRIAFLSAGRGSTPMCPIYVYVLDVATGEKKIVARDAIPTAQVWEQPWSPDGKSIVYLSLPAAKTDANSYSFLLNFGGISIASASGGGTSKIIDQTMTLCPSWSPKGDRIAYVGPAKDEGLGSINTVIYACDVNGKKPVSIGEPVYAKDPLGGVRGQMRDAVVEILKQDYPGTFTQAQLILLYNLERTSDSDAIDTITLAQCRLTGELEGGEFGRKIEAAMKQLSVYLKNIGEVERVARQAVKDLPEEKRNAIDRAVGTRITQIAKTFVRVESGVEKSPVWSPDGKRVAFIRQNHLIVADLATNDTKVVFESNSVATVSWTKDGKRLLLQAKRRLAFGGWLGEKASPEPPRAQWTEVVSTLSYPEIWLIELE